ncbi:hypothetical protein BGZ99_006569 [Dissophora globulifera]|uniref:C2H2-type domain-containing protein n=1 Tax=Dissophora globulifera TaxID=979702 RepID=A0A9P6US72_9FUNG|nr:hypothetical protein BGZ99_006569 [Dissophora globulifera]
MTDFGNMPVVIDPAPLVNNSSPLANPGRHCLVGPELDALYTFDRSGTHVNLSHGSQGQVTNGGVRDDESVEGTEVDDDEARFQLWQGSHLSSTPPLSPPNNAELPYQYRQPPQQQHQCYPYPYQQHSQRQSESLLAPHDQPSSNIQTELLLQSLTGLSSPNSTTTLESPSASGLSTHTLHLMLGADQTDLSRGLGSSGKQQPLHQQQQPKKQQRRTKKQKQQSISLPSQVPAHSPLTLLATQAEQVIGNSVDENSMARLMDGADPGFGSRQSDAAAAIHIPEARLFQCQLCHKRFLRQYNLNAHHKTHSLERAYRCHDCPRSFLRPYDLSRHQRIHSKDKPYSCEICDMVFIRNDAIWRHYRKDHPDHPDVPVSRRDRKRQRNTIVAVAAAMAASRTARAASKSSAKTSTGRAKRGPAKAPKNAIVVTNA